ncbi:MAG: heparinase II/III family protein [Spirochaetes bacterium]|nr:heparinase II/III family protein [Spirochaetota bacterium]
MRLPAILLLTAFCAAPLVAERSPVSIDGIKLKPWSGRLALTNLPWDALIQEAATDPDAGNRFADWKKQATAWAAGDLIRRPKTLEEIPMGRLDRRAGACGPNARRFALAMDDQAVWGMLGRQLIPAALVVRRSGDKAALDYLSRQLAEIAQWWPLQRPGWSLDAPDSKLTGEHDGPALAEGFAMGSLAFAIDILGARLDGKNRAELRSLLQKEIDWIARAWKEKIPRYVGAKAYGETLWALPSAALVLGCLALGEEKNRAAYELGAENLAKWLAAQGEDGSFSGGYAYAGQAMDYVFPALWAMERAGDRRLGTAPFLKRYAFWFHQQTFPGMTVVNHGDCGTTWVASTPARHLMLATLLSRDPGDLWAMERFYPTFDLADPFSILYRVEARKLPPSRAPLPLSAFFPKTQLAVWRSDWDLGNAMALWAKGGSPAEPRPHNDQGQVVVMNGEEPVLIDAGAVVGGAPGEDERFACSESHSVIQTPSGPKRLKQGVRATLSIERMDASGGLLRIDASGCQPEVKSWQRRLAWTAEGRVTVVDEAELLEGKRAGDEWFRWQTGALQAPRIAGSGKLWSATWGSNRLDLEADRPIAVSSVRWTSALLKEHFAVVVKAAEPGVALRLSTVVSFARKVAKPPTTRIPYLEYLKGRLPGAPGEPIVLQGEDMLPPGSGMRVATDKVGAKNAVTGWDALGARLEKEVAVAEEGWYFIGAKYCTPLAALRAVEIDGEVPFAEADRIPLPATLPFPDSDGFANHADDWSFALLGARADRPGLLFKLGAGKHRIAFINRGNPCELDYFALIPEGQTRLDLMDR